MIAETKKIILKLHPKHKTKLHLVFKFWAEHCTLTKNNLNKTPFV
jgi:hypothetical protein